jgi:hypothetical protein
MSFITMYHKLFDAYSRAPPRPRCRDAVQGVTGAGAGPVGQLKAEAVRRDAVEREVAGLKQVHLAAISCIDASHKRVP